MRCFKICIEQKALLALCLWNTFHSNKGMPIKKKKITCAENVKTIMFYYQFVGLGPQLSGPFCGDFFEFWLELQIKKWELKLYSSDCFKIKSW